MYTVNNSHPSFSTPDVDAFASWLVELFELRDCWFEPFPFEVQLPRLERGRIVLPAVEPGVKPWEYDAGVELPVRADGLTLGRFILVPDERTCGVVLSAADRALAIESVEPIAAAVATEMRVGA
jgi:hypothetical protein